MSAMDDLQVGMGTPPADTPETPTQRRRRQRKPPLWLVVSVRDDDDVLQGALVEMESRGYWIRKIIHRWLRGVYVIVGARR